MAIQYSDDSFSKTLPYDELMEKFFKEIEEVHGIKALHFGTFREIESVKEKASIENRLDELEQKVKEMSPVRTTLEIPTSDEIRKFTRKQTPSNFHKTAQEDEIKKGVDFIMNVSFGGD